MINSDKYVLLALNDKDLKSGMGAVFEKLGGIDKDLLLDLLAVTEADAEAAELLMEKLTDMLEDILVIMVGDEEKLEELGLMDDDIPVTPTLSEALDYLYMLQLERELGDEE